MIEAAVSKYTIADMRRIARKRGGKCLSDACKGAHVKLRWQCGRGHVWEATPSSLVNARSWCPHCAGNRRLSMADMRDTARAKGGKCLSDWYGGVHAKLRWRCSAGHTWEASAGSIRQGSWCPQCAGVARKSLSDMHAIAGERAGRCLSDKYTDARTPLRWECAAGHTWEASASNVVRGTWCPHCSGGRGERICREYFEQLFGRPFPKSHPQWLRINRHIRLELDGYCEELALAFEHQGPHHYGHGKHLSMSKTRLAQQAQYDETKRQRCGKRGIVLIEVPEIPRLLPIRRVRAFIRAECLRAGVALPTTFDKVRIRLGKAYSVDPATEALKSMRTLAEAKGGKCLSRSYRGTAAKLLWECSQGHRWKATPGNVSSGKWCPYCAGHRQTIHDMRAVAKQRGGKCLSKRFVRMKSHLEWECSKGHRWKASAVSVKTLGRWCPICAGRVPGTIGDAKAMAEERGGKCLSRRYAGYHSCLRWRCSCGHEWEATFASVKWGTWCSVCAIAKRVNNRKGKTARVGLERLREIARQRGGECLSTTYRNRKTPMRWKCAKGHVWETTYASIHNGTWCPSCAKNRH